MAPHPTNHIASILQIKVLVCSLILISSISIAQTKYVIDFNSKCDTESTNPLLGGCELYQEYHTITEYSFVLTETENPRLFSVSQFDANMDQKIYSVYTCYDNYCMAKTSTHVNTSQRPTAYGITQIIDQLTKSKIEFSDDCGEGLPKCVFPPPVWSFEITSLYSYSEKGYQFDHENCSVINFDDNWTDIFDSRYNINSVPGESRLFAINQEATMYENKGAEIRPWKTDQSEGILRMTYWITLEVLGDCQIPVIHLNQYDSQWGNDKYDHTRKSIRRLGCALTSLTMAINYAGDPDVRTDPGELNDWMKDPGNNGYEGPSVHFINTVEGFSDFLTWYPGGNRSTLTNREKADQYLQDALCKEQLPIIVATSRRKRGGRWIWGHFVLVTGMKDGRFQISDPGGKEKRYLDQYGEHYLIRGGVQKKSNSGGGRNSGEVERLIANTHDKIDLMVVDPKGNSTGYDAKLEKVIEEIDSSYVHYETTWDDSLQVLGEEEVEFFEFYNLIAGEYLLKVYPEEAGAYRINFTLSNSGKETTFLIDSTFNSINEFHHYALGYDGETITVNPLVTGLSANSKNIQIFPIPFDEILHINYTANNKSNVLIKIYDIIGKEINNITSKTDPKKPYSNQLSMKGVKAGIYILEIIEDGKIVYSTKLIKKK